MIPPFLQPGIINRGYYYSGVNFASAGAGALVETFQGDVSVCAHMYSSHFWNEITVVIICILTCTLAFILGILQGNVYITCIYRVELM